MPRWSSKYPVNRPNTPLALKIHRQHQIPYSPSLLRELVRHRNIAIRNLLQKRSIRPVQHDVEMLHCMHTLQTLPILEPDQLLDFGSECLLNIVVDLLL
jgi:hypothetical protein